MRGGLQLRGAKLLRGKRDVTVRANTLIREAPRPPCRPRRQERAVSAEALADGWTVVADTEQEFVGYSAVSVETDVLAYRQVDEVAGDLGAEALVGVGGVQRGSADAVAVGLHAGDDRVFLPLLLSSTVGWRRDSHSQNRPTSTSGMLSSWPMVSQPNAR